MGRGERKGGRAGYRRAQRRKCENGRNEIRTGERRESRERVEGLGWRETESLREERGKTGRIKGSEIHKEQCSYH